MNFIHIAGHLGSDPETRFTSSGKKVTTLRVACRTRKGQTDDTIWYRVTIWGDQYDKMMSYFKKGSPIVVAGELGKPEIFTDREGKNLVSMDVTASFIQFSPFGKPGSGGQGEGQHQQVHAQVHGTPVASQSYSSPSPSSYAAAGQTHTPKGDTFDDEVPF